jgi:hypothetical protein
MTRRDIAFFALYTGFWMSELAILTAMGGEPASSPLLFPYFFYAITGVAALAALAAWADRKHGGRSGRADA